VRVISNREYNLSVASNPDKWAMFVFLTFCTVGVPYLLWWKNEQSYKGGVKKTMS